MLDKRGIIFHSSPLIHRLRKCRCHFLSGGVDVRVSSRVTVIKGFSGLVCFLVFFVVALYSLSIYWLFFLCLALDHCPDLPIHTPLSTWRLRRDTFLRCGWVVIELMDVMEELEKLRKKIAKQTMSMLI